MELTRMGENLLEISKHLTLLQEFISLAIGSDWELDFKNFCSNTPTPYDQQHPPPSEVYVEVNTSEIVGDAPTTVVDIKGVPHLLPIPQSSTTTTTSTSIDEVVDKLDIVPYTKKLEDVFIDEEEETTGGGDGNQEPEFVGVDFEDVETFEPFQQNLNLEVTGLGGESRGGNARIKCRRCQSSFTRKTSLQRHLKSKACFRARECPICFKNFYNEVSYALHFRTHQQPPGKPFSKVKQRNMKKWRTLLSNTVAAVKSKEMTTCQGCKKSFSRKWTLTRHLQRSNCSTTSTVPAVPHDPITMTDVEVPDVRLQNQHSSSPTFDEGVDSFLVSSEVKLERVDDLYVTRPS